MTRKRRTSARKQARQERSRATVDAILEATARVVAERGYRGATTTRIAEVAGVSVGSLYQYFPSKDALIGALIDDHNRRVRELTTTALASRPDVPFEVAVRETIPAIIELNRVHAAVKKVMLEQLPQTDRLDDVQALEGDVRRAVVALFERYRDDLHTDDLEMCGFIVTFAVEQVVHAAVIHRPEYLADPSFTDELCRLVLRYALE